ncbi:MAG: hypothetical protein MI746_01345 [Pseudomonadales bacterium]|nr:hypothetical protein [Pseudomonadales bacterium]
MADKCQNHPNAPAVETCARCSIPLCGMCANFTDDAVLCENCVELWQAEQTVARETQRIEQQQARERAAVEVTAQQEATPVVVRRKQSNPQLIPLVVTIVCVTIIVARQLFFSAPDFVPLDDETRIRQLRITSFEECMRVFAQIGQALARGDTPSDSLRCDGSGQGNIVTREGNNVIIEHPQPDFYGYSRIYVSRNSPEPTLVD